MFHISTETRLRFIVQYSIYDHQFLEPGKNCIKTFFFQFQINWQFPEFCKIFSPR